MASPSLSSLNPTLLLLSFGSTHSSVLVPFCCCSICCCSVCLSVSASALFSRPPLSLRSILFLPHRIADPFFPIHPLSFLLLHLLLLRASLQFSKCLDGRLAAPVTAQGVRRAKVGPVCRRTSHRHTHLNKQTEARPLSLAPISIVSCLLPAYVSTFSRSQSLSVHAA